VTRDFFPGSDLTKRVRVDEDHQYKVRFLVTSAQQSNLNCQMRLRARTLKFAWNQKFEIGGAWPTNGVPSYTIAQQALPGVGCLNPDVGGFADGGWYTLLIQSPMNRDIRTEGAVDTPLTTEMPNISAEPAEGTNSASKRDLRIGFDLIDTLSGGTNATLEKGNFTLREIDVWDIPQVED